MIIFKKASFLMKGFSIISLVKNNEFLIAILSTKMKKKLKGALYMLNFYKKVPFYNDKILIYPKMFIISIGPKLCVMTGQSTKI